MSKNQQRWNLNGFCAIPSPSQSSARPPSSSRLPPATLSLSLLPRFPSLSVSAGRFIPTGPPNQPLSLCQHIIMIKIEQQHHIHGAGWLVFVYPPPLVYALIQHNSVTSIYRLFRRRDSHSPLSLSLSTSPPNIDPTSTATAIFFSLSPYNSFMA